MKKIKEQIETIYKELAYIKLEFNLMENIVDSLIKNEKEMKKIEIISFLMVDSLWYTIIMRISKVWDNHSGTGSLLKILNKIETLSEMEDLRNKISIQTICQFKCDIKNLMEDIDEKGKINNLFIESRHKYFAHLGSLNSPKEAQETYLIGRKRIKALVELLFKVVERLCRELNIYTAKVDLYHKLNILSNVEYPYFVKLITDRENNM